MGVPTSEVGYTPAMPRREDHEVHKGHVMALEKEKKNTGFVMSVRSSVRMKLLGCHRTDFSEI